MRQKRKAEYERLALKIHPRLKRRLEKLQEETMAESISQVIRRALAVYDALLTHEKSGGQILVRDNNGIEREILHIE